MNTIDPVQIAGAVTSLCCCFLVVVGLGYLAWRLFTKKPPPQQPMQRQPEAVLTDRRAPASALPPVSGRVAQYGNIVSNLTDDGFYLFNNYLSPGSMIHYRYRGPSGWVTRCVPYQPGPQGHYVYVGNTPRDVQVVDVVPASIPDREHYSEPTIMQSNPFSNPPSTDLTPDGSGSVPPSMVSTTSSDYPSAY